VRGILKLPPGVKVKVLNYDPVMKRVDMKQRFPPGYVEPAHTHMSWLRSWSPRAACALQARIFILATTSSAGTSRTGPTSHPDGCEVFIVYMGDATHVWKEEDLLKHKNIRSRPSITTCSTEHPFFNALTEPRH